MVPVGCERMKMVGEGSEKLPERRLQGLAGRGDVNAFYACYPSVESLRCNLVAKPTLIGVGSRSKRTKRACPVAVEECVSVNLEIVKAGGMRALYGMCVVLQQPRVDTSMSGFWNQPRV